MKVLVRSTFILSLTCAFAAGVFAKTTLTGPTQGKGLSNKTVGDIVLSDEIKTLKGHRLRMRYWNIMPGGIVPIHSHVGRPGIIYVESGEIVEHRSDRKEPKVHGVGSISIESNGISHWWENKGNEIVNLVAVDVHKP